MSCNVQLNFGWFAYAPCCCCPSRCFCCEPAAAGSVLLCDSCDAQRHAGAHLHNRQQFVSAGYWQDLPRADPDTGGYGGQATLCVVVVRPSADATGVLVAGYFRFKPSRCSHCGGSDCFGDAPHQLQPLDYITRGKACHQHMRWCPVNMAPLCHVQVLLPCVVVCLLDACRCKCCSRDTTARGRACNATGAIIACWVSKAAALLLLLRCCCCCCCCRWSHCGKACGLQVQHLLAGGVAAAAGLCAHTGLACVTQ